MSMASDGLTTTVVSRYRDGYQGCEFDERGDGKMGFVCLCCRQEGSRTVVRMEGLRWNWHVLMKLAVGFEYEVFVEMS